MLPKLSGYELCGKVREEGNATPILMLTARGEEADRSMLNFYINRAGRNLPAERKKILEQATAELRELFQRR
jgi:CheY-like chemotaxis protein